MGSCNQQTLHRCENLAIDRSDMSRIGLRDPKQDWSACRGARQRILILHDLVDGGRFVQQRLTVRLSDIPRRERATPSTSTPRPHRKHVAAALRRESHSRPVRFTKFQKMLPNNLTMEHPPAAAANQRQTHGTKNSETCLAHQMTLFDDNDRKQRRLVG